MPETHHPGPLLRAHPARVDIHIPSPAAAGKPFQNAGLWHAAHANNLRRMMAALGYEEIDHHGAKGDGKGANISFVSYDPLATPGLVPEAVQKYLEEHLTGSAFAALRVFAGAAKAILKVVAGVIPVPPVAVALNGIIVGLSVGEQVIEVLDNTDEAGA